MSKKSRSAMRNLYFRQIQDEKFYCNSQDHRHTQENILIVQLPGTKGPTLDCFSLYSLYNRHELDQTKLKLESACRNSFGRGSAEVSLEIAHKDHSKMSKKICCPATPIKFSCKFGWTRARCHQEICFWTLYLCKRVLPYTSTHL